MQDKHDGRNGQHVSFIIHDLGIVVGDLPE